MRIQLRSISQTIEQFMSGNTYQYKKAQQFFFLIIGHFRKKIVTLHNITISKQESGISYLILNIIVESNIP